MFSYLKCDPVLNQKRISLSFIDLRHGNVNKPIYDAGIDKWKVYLINNQFVINN
jgi:hypothetical protein